MTDISRILATSAMLLVAAGGAASAATIIVATTGNDANDGSTLQLAVATVQHAVDLAQPGDIIEVYPGTYAPTSGSGNSALLIDKAGYELARITLRGVDPDDRPLVSGGAITAGAGSNIRALYMGANAAFWTIQDIDFGNAAQGSPNGNNGNGIEIEGGDDILIERVASKDNSGVGIRVAGDSHNVVLKDCDSINSYHPPNPGESDGLQMVNMPATTYGNKIIGCRVLWGADDGIDLWMNEGAVEIRDTIVARAGMLPNSTTPAGDGGLGTGFKLGETTTGPRHRIINNIACENNVSGFNSNGARAMLEIVGNTSFNNSNSEFGLIYGGPHYLRNNVAYPDNDVFNHFQNNDAYNSWTAANVTVTAADFVSLDCTQFFGARDADGSLPGDTVATLVAGSDLIDKGENVCLPYTGTAPDLGARERP